MLGRLEMTVEDCITTYTEFMGQVFPKSSWPQALIDAGNKVKAARGQPKWDAGDLERVVKNLVHKTLGQDPNTVLLQDPKNPDPLCKV
jgi:hypothetical protein